MFGIRFIKTQPTTFLMAYRKGKIVAQGAGLSKFYYAPTTTLVAIPVASREEPFIFEKLTSDFQTITIQGNISFRIADPVKTAGLMNFALKADGISYAAKDPDKLPERVVAVTHVLVQQMIQTMALSDAIRAAGRIANNVLADLRKNHEIAALGVEILGLAVLAVKPTPETGRALEAKAREAILQEADDAVFARRNAAVENERAIKQNELDTEVAVEQKKRTIRETQMEAEASIRRKKNDLRQEEMEADIEIEDRRQDFVKINADNTRTIAEAEAHRLTAVLKALQSVDPRIVQALASIGMKPSKLIAQAFGSIAEKAERIGQLNMSPDLLQALMAPDEREKARGQS